MKCKHVIGVLTICLLLVGAAWALEWFGGEDAEVTALREEFENRDQLSEEDRDAFRDRIRSLDDNQRRQLFEPMMQARQAEMQARVYALMSMPEAERRAELDKWINEMEKRRRSWEGRRGNAPNRGEMTNAQRAQRGKARLDRSTPELRATMTQMMKMVNKRREERGMEQIGRRR